MNGLLMIILKKTIYILACHSSRRFFSFLNFSIVVQPDGLKAKGKHHVRCIIFFGLKKDC